MTLGDFVMYVFFTGLVAAPLVQIASIGTQISEAFAGLDRIRELRRMATEDAEDGRRERRSATSSRARSRFEDVGFAYTPACRCCKGVSFRAPAGSTTALVGSSGSGKSTLISPGDGVQPARRRAASWSTGRTSPALRLRDYRAHLGVVLQDNFLFDGTIAENIGFAQPHATREEILRVAASPTATSSSRQFEKGYDTIVGERGVKLSGGQRQRVAIARAILADPRILILDEATSSLDSESEALIQDGLRRLRQGRTTFVIAHRLSTIRSADQILVLEARRDRRARHARASCWRAAAATASSTTSSTASSATGSSIPARTSRRSRRPPPRRRRRRCGRALRPAGSRTRTPPSSAGRPAAAPPSPRGTPRRPARTRPPSAAMTSSGRCSNAARR